MANILGKHKQLMVIGALTEGSSIQSMPETAVRGAIVYEYRSRGKAEEN